MLGLPLLQACVPMQIRDAQTGAWLPVRGGTLEVHRNIEIPADSRRAFFQDGAAVRNIDEFKPFCQIEVTTLRAAPQTIRSDTFAATPLGEWSEQVVGKVVETPVQLAALRVNSSSSWGGDGAPSVRNMLYFRLHSPSQPDVRGLACGGARDDPIDAVAPTLQEIAAALGNYATLTPH